MRAMLAATLWLISVVPSPAQSPVAAAPAEPLGSVLPKVDQPSDLFAVPFYLVDTTRPGGTTTLYAVRNVTDRFIQLEVEYFRADGSLIRREAAELGPRQTLTVNLRDVPGLPVDPDGFARGFVRITVVQAPAIDNLTGDFFQVDVDGNFATGDRLITVADLCEVSEVRTLDFGSGTRLRIFVNEPQGADPETDLPSFTVTAVDEGGNASPPQEIFTDQVVVERDAVDFTGEAFGTLVFRFTAGGGYVYAEYSAGGRFSVGLNSACRLP